jgi:hypothetical protein
MIMHRIIRDANSPEPKKRIAIVFDHYSLILELVEI